MHQCFQRMLPLHCKQSLPDIWHHEATTNVRCIGPACDKMKGNIMFRNVSDHKHCHFGRICSAMPHWFGTWQTPLRKNNDFLKMSNPFWVSCTFSEVSNGKFSQTIFKIYCVGHWDKSETWDGASGIHQQTQFPDKSFQWQLLEVLQRFCVQHIQISKQAIAWVLWFEIGCLRLVQDLVSLCSGFKLEFDKSRQFAAIFTAALHALDLWDLFVILDCSKQWSLQSQLVPSKVFAHFWIPSIALLLCWACLGCTLGMTSAPVSLYTSPFCWKPNKSRNMPPTWLPFHTP